MLDSVARPVRLVWPRVAGIPSREIPRLVDPQLGVPPGPRRSVHPQRGFRAGIDAPPPVHHRFQALPSDRLRRAYRLRHGRSLRPSLRRHGSRRPAEAVRPPGEIGAQQRLRVGIRHSLRRFQRDAFKEKGPFHLFPAAAKCRRQHHCQQHQPSRPSPQPPHVVHSLPFAALGGCTNKPSRRRICGGSPQLPFFSSGVPASSASRRVSSGVRFRPIFTAK